MPLQDYPSWELKPRHLHGEELENPVKVIHDFYSYCHLPEIRRKLWELLKTAVTGDYSRALSGKERSDLVYFYEQLEKLIEGTHVIHLQHKEQDSQESL